MKFKDIIQQDKLDEVKMSRAIKMSDFDKMISTAKMLSSGQTMTITKDGDVFKYVVDTPDVGD